MEGKYQVLRPDLQIDFYSRLKSIKKQFFHSALGEAVSKLELTTVNRELSEVVSDYSLKKLAACSLRGEVVFAVPAILRTDPYLIGYYRLLLGFSQKEFYGKGPFGSFKLMEENGRLTKTANENLFELCSSLNKSAMILLDEIDSISHMDIYELQLLTVGPQLRGSMNNKYGQAATARTFSLIKGIFSQHIEKETASSVTLRNSSGRPVTIKFSADPDIEIIEEMPTGKRCLVSIEIKGGEDHSNIHNRIGEAEKSHQKAKKRGYFEFMTIISVDIDYQALKNESPTTSHFFNLNKINDNSTYEYSRFVDILSSMMGVNT